MGSYFFEYIIKISIGSLEFTINWILSKFLNKKYFYLKITCFLYYKINIYSLVTEKFMFV